MKIWIIGDTHWYHTKLIEFENRPVNFNEIIIDNWNKLVAPEDLVIHLGDVIFGLNKEIELPKIMSRLNGKKVLCRGNHDSYPKSKWGDWTWFIERGFDMVVDYFVYQDIAYSHAPLTPLPNQSLLNQGIPVKYNIHAHFHRGHTRLPQSKLAEAEFKDEFYDYQYYKNNKDKYKLIQIEDNLSPVLLEDVLKEGGEA